MEAKTPRRVVPVRVDVTTVPDGTVVMTASRSTFGQRRGLSRESLPPSTFYSMQLADDDFPFSHVTAS